MTEMLFDLLFRVVAVLAVAVVVVTTMRRTSASLRALALTATLAGTLVLPMIAIVAPKLEVAVLPAERVVAERVVAERAERAPGVIEPTAMPTSTAVSVGADHGRDMMVPSTTIADASRSILDSPVDIAPPASHTSSLADRAAEMGGWLVSRISIPGALAAVWMIGALLLLVRLAGGHRRLDHLVTSANDASSDWHATVDAVRAELGIERHVGVRTSHDIDVPAVAGVFSPVLLVPASIDWSRDGQRDVALHELAHVARWDALAQLLSNVATAVYWFIPLTWYAARQAAALREQACDNVVLRAGTRPSLYAQRLLTLTNVPMSTALEPVALAMARPAHIQRRVLDILDTKTRRTRLSASFTTAFIAGALGVVALVAIVEPVSASQPQRDRRTPSAPPSVAAVRSAAVGVVAVAPTAQSASLSISGGQQLVSAVAVVPGAVSVLPSATSDVGPSPADPASSTGATPSPTSVDAPITTPLSILQATPALDIAPPAAARLVVQQQALVLCKDGTKNHTINSHSNRTGNKHTWKLTTNGPGCDITVRIEGKPTFNREFTDVARIDGEGIFEVDVRQDGVRRELRITDDNGRLSRTYRVDGRERPYDAEAAAWFGQLLIALDRMTAFAVDVRLPLMLERGGVNAVLAETGEIKSDYARTAYYTALSKARRLSPQEVTSVINQGAELTKSDYYATELLKGVGKQGLGDPSVRDGVARLITRMTSDYYKLESIKATVNAGQPSSTEVDLLVQAVASMKSDYYRAESVKLLTANSDLPSRQLGEILAIAPKMTSDHHLNEMLGTLVSRGTLDADKRITYITAARNIDSDYHRSEALGRLLRNGAPTTGEMDLLLTAISEIDSDHYMGEVLDRLLASRSLREADLLRTEEVARKIGSDHTHSEILRRIGSHAGATDAVRSAVRTTAATLSRHYREQVERGVER